MTARRKLNKTRISDLRVLACGFFLEEYPRFDTLWEALSRLGLQELIDLRDKQTLNDEYFENLRAEEGRSTFHRITRRIRSVYRLCTRAVSTARTARQKKVDIIFVFPVNVFLAICLGMLKFIHGAKVYFDLNTSAYSAARTHAPGRFNIAEAYVLEFLSIRFADQLICASQEYTNYYKNLYRIREDKFSVVIDGVQDVWFEQPVSISQEVHRPKRVLYWGNYLVQHGLDIILDSAEELRDDNVQFVFCGKGGKEDWVREEARRRNLSNVVFKGFAPTTKELIRIIDSVDITLGHLKNMHDTGLAPSNKLKQGMARRKPVLTIWTKQKEDMYQTKDNPLPPLIQIEPGARALTKAIRDLINNPEKAEQIGDVARSTVKRLHSVEAVTSALKESLEKTLRKAE